MGSELAAFGRILLALDNRENRRLLRECLEQRYEILEAAPERDLDAAFDLCILDGRALARSGAALNARKQVELPVFLPFLLVTTRENVAMLTPHLWKNLDEVVTVPIEKLELQARVENLLHARRLSMELKLRSDDLEAFIHAMTHDLRAPLRSITGFAEMLAEEEAPRMTERGRHRVARIRGAAQEMWELIASLVEFSRLGRKAIRLQTVSVKNLIDSCVESMRDEIARKDAEIRVPDDLGAVQADPSLLRIAVSNLLSNAVKFVAPGARPHVSVEVARGGGRPRLIVRDNGIGLKPEDRERIFTPFIRLHGVEDYPGAGLGLSAARKAVDIMGGQIGVDSSPGAGSTFWIELPSGGEA